MWSLDGVTHHLLSPAILIRNNCFLQVDARMKGEILKTSPARCNSQP
jgi:hypothetical protein